MITVGAGRSRPRFAEEWLVAVLDSLSEGVIAIDAEGRLTAANPAAEAALGFVVAERRYEHWSALGLGRLEDADGRRLDPHPIAHTLVHAQPVTVTTVAPDAVGQPWLELSTHVLDPVAGAGSGVVVSFRDVTDRVSALRERERALSVLRDVLAMTSHDLRGPISTIAGHAELLDDHVDVADTDGRASLAAIQRQADHLGRLVVDLSLAARIEAGGLAPEPMTIQLCEVIDEAIQEVGLERVQRDVDEQLVLVSDRDHLRRVVANLVSNAGKYGAPPVRVEGRRDGDVAVIVVSDAGDGVPESFVPSLFDRFTRAHGSDHASGSGLGLAIVHGLASLNGGSVDYEPGDPGARFVVRVPLEPASPVDATSAASVTTPADPEVGT